MFPYYTDAKTALGFLTTRKTNLERSNYMSWIRLTSKVGGGLVIESIPSSTGFTTRYGDMSKSGMIGIDAVVGSQKPIYANETGDSAKVLHPSPTIETVSVSQGGNALSNRFEFTIKCSSVAQLQQLQEHFMEPGFAVLIEFGWNTPESYSERVDVTSLCGVLSRYHSSNILDAMKNSNGEYFGILGFITGGDCTNDGTGWLLNAKITSMGLLPTYIQPHKGIDTNENKKKVSLAYSEKEMEEARKNKLWGELFFMYMFNGLNEDKQTASVKNLVDTISPSGKFYSDRCHFLNFDSELVEKINSNLGDDLVDVQTDDTRDKYSGGVIKMGLPDVLLKKDAKFITLDLAFGIINAVNSGLNNSNPQCNAFTNTTIPPASINGWNTVCRAFKNIYSTDYTKLYIPNQNLPDFDFQTFLKESTTLQNPTNFYDYILDPKNVVDGRTRADIPKGNSAPIPAPNAQQAPPINFTQPLQASNSYIQFPENITLDKSVINSFKTVDGMTKSFKDLADQSIDAYNWGYLRNLYVNFDFFKSIISRPNLLAKDIYYELLNGISTAVNSYWHFELIETEYGVCVADIKLSPNYINTGNAFPTINLQGKDSNVIGFNYNLDIPGAMMNKVMANNLSVSNNVANIADPCIEISDIYDGLFSIQKDPIVEYFSNAYNTDNTKGGKADTEIPVKNPRDNVRSNIKESINNYIGKVTFICRDSDLAHTNLPKWLNFLGLAGSSDPSDPNIKNNVFFAGCFSDTAVFSKLETNNLKGEVGKGMLLPIKIQIDVPGISGIRVGDLFKVKGGIVRYEDYAFQVVKVEHEVGQQWITKIEAQIRNVKI
jgi:hypothetical protein